MYTNNFPIVNLFRANRLFSQITHLHLSSFSVLACTSLTYLLPKQLLVSGRDHMKIYYDRQSIRMVGKAWQIRARLRSWSKRAITIQDLLRQKGHRVNDQ
ncbi:Z-ring formation inhibitor MciZ [Ammoniphilus oxalaticus]|uniref:Z-ring formation inhibitor MciZ n=1 Tax=Ammoniphilus oxalaticus TaxID=66863 RepID=UPI003CCC5CAC